MTFTWLTPAAVLGGLAALAAALYALQRLRVRHRTVEVVTTLFWREAVEESRARVFVQRFRHPWAYALVLAIAGLMWLAVAGPRPSTAKEREHVVVLDRSAGMAWGTRWRDAVQRVVERAAELPRDSTRVVAAGARFETLLDSGEPLALLQRRLQGLRPEATTASVERCVLELAHTTAPAGGREVEIVGDAELTLAALELLPERVRVARHDLGAPSRPSGAGIVALGVTEARSGAWDRVDVLVRIAGDAASSAAFEARLDATPFRGFERETTSDEPRWIARDVDARGQTLEIALATADAFGADDRARLVLPNRPPIRVAIAPEAPRALRAALALDSGVALVEVGADVVVRRTGDAWGGELAALEWTADESNDAAFVVRHGGGRDPDAAVREAFVELGLGEIDSTALAQQAGRAIELVFEASARRQVQVWASLCGPGFDFAQSRAFPLFVARSVRFLAGAQRFAFEAAAGRFARVEASALPLESARQRLDPLDAEFRWPRADSWSSSDGGAMHASLLDVAASAACTGANAAALPVPTSGAPAIDWLPLVVLAALALLAVEWWLVRMERMP
jgi:hypothetical protein